MECMQVKQCTNLVLKLSIYKVIVIACICNNKTYVSTNTCKKLNIRSPKVARLMSYNIGSYYLSSNIMCWMLARTKHLIFESFFFLFEMFRAKIYIFNSRFVEFNQRIASYIWS
jgi:hypothetical protein